MVSVDSPESWSCGGLTSLISEPLSGRPGPNSASQAQLLPIPLSRSTGDKPLTVVYSIVTMQQKKTPELRKLMKLAQQYGR